MWRKLNILSRFELRQTWDDKMVLFYTLIAPVVFFVITDLSSNGHPFGVHDLASQLLAYWVYIVLVGVLNGFQFTLIGMRESNFLKMFTVIAGDKRLIFFSNLIVQVLFIEVEVFFFDLVVLGLNPASLTLLPMMAGGLLLNVILIPIVVGFTNFLLILPLRVNLVSLITAGYIFVGMFLISPGLGLAPWINEVLAAFNPCSYMIQFYSVGLDILRRVTLLHVGLLTGVAVFYLLIGYYPVRHMKLQSNTNRY
ncbi:hypothetical protein [Levilactobacillus fujinensis]|uniref:ABC-2 type transporter domain-containing protein n=1 Tax=Levilactobacillus fujinensis TaxID=2486024 RepID=A0ABW1TCD2_9LACO|nr:hypothetical protein [Levilactobacillus fujinensis]